ncbi:MAG: hypothetical protein MRZ77_07775 [Clostridiales bacterium]|nr:hypothetical protein [Clostridiales bacterium]MDY5975064.1 hypothetical protein [Anaerovoracaceae bacterium]
MELIGGPRNILNVYSADVEPRTVICRGLVCIKVPADETTKRRIPPVTERKRSESGYSAANI